MASPVVIRTCVGCRGRSAKIELLRLVAGEDTHDPSKRVVLADPRAVATGRGAYLHPTTECLALAERRRAFPRALRVPQGISTDALHEFVAQFDRPDRERPRWSISS